MKLFEALQVYEDLCIDTADDVFDCIVTIDWNRADEPNDNCGKFAVELFKKVELVKFFNGAYANAICKWSDLVKNNIEVFKDFVKKEWIESKQYVLEDDDDLQFEWVEQFHLLLAGYGTETDYKKMLNLLSKCN